MKTGLFIEVIRFCQVLYTRADDKTIRVLKLNDNAE